MSDKPSDSSLTDQDSADKVDAVAADVEQAAADAGDAVGEAADTVDAAAGDVADTATDTATEVGQDVAETVADEAPAAAVEESSSGSTFAGTALKLLLLVLVIFGLSLWLVPMAAPHLPERIAKHIMPYQQTMDARLAAVEDAALKKADSAKADIVSLQKTVEQLTERLTAAEAAAAKSAETAAAAQEGVSISAEAAKGAEEASKAVQAAAAAAADAAKTAQGANTTAAEASKTATAATTGVVALTEQVTSAQSRIEALAKELGAMSESLAQGQGDEGPTATEVAAALAALTARVEGIGKRVGPEGDLVLKSDAAVFATQDDVRAARTALEATLAEQLKAVPKLEASVGETVAALSQKVDAAEAGAAAAQKGAEEAAKASADAVGSVDAAIKSASLRSAIAVLETRLASGVAFGGPLEEIENLSGQAAPEALKSAAGGIPTAAMLLGRFGAAARSAQAAELAAEAGDSAAGQAGASIRSLLSGRPVGETDGNSIDAILSRIEARLKEGDLAAAETEAGTLSEAAQGGLGDWLAGLKARTAADAAVSDFISGLQETKG